MLEELYKKFDNMQKKYGAKNLNSIYSGGCINNPNICFVFMNPTGRNIAAEKSWTGIRAPWLATKNIWKLFREVNLLDEDIYEQIQNKKGKEWTPGFCEEVYSNIEKHKCYITNLAKCTQIDARSLKDEVYIKYLKLFFKELEIVNPKIVILFGNQVSSIVLDQKIQVSLVRKQEFMLKNKYKCFSVYYPVGNGIFNIDKSIEDIIYIINKELKNKNI